MRTLKNSELKTLKKILGLNQESLKKVVTTFLKSHYPKVVETPHYVFAEGSIPVVLVAHLDTVFEVPPEIYFDSDKNVMLSTYGLGADDRAGVFAIIQIIRSGLLPHVLFTTDEEMGCIGASMLTSIECPFKDLRYVIELDRRGSNDCVFYDCDNEDFVSYIESFGFSWNFGSFSDISILCPYWEKAGVNLSVGYYNEHSAGETLHIDQLLNTINRVKQMLSEKEIPEFIYVSTYHWNTAFDSAFYTDGIIQCHDCKKHFVEEEMCPAIMQDKSTKFFCPDCIVNDIAWCKICGSAYQKYSSEAPDEGICPLCLELEAKINDTKTV